MRHHHKGVPLGQVFICIGVILVRMVPVFTAEVIAHHFLTMTFSRNRRIDCVSWLVVAALFNLVMPGRLPLPGEARFSVASQSYSRFAKILYDSLRVLHGWVEVRFAWFCVSLLLATSGHVNMNQLHVYVDSPLLMGQAHVAAVVCLALSICVTDHRCGVSGKMIPKTFCRAIENLLRRTHSTCSCASTVTASSSGSSLHSESSTESSVSTCTRNLLRQFKNDLETAAIRKGRKRRGSASRTRARSQVRKKRPVSKARVGRPRAVRRESVGAGV